MQDSAAPHPMQDFTVLHTHDTPAPQPPATGVPAFPCEGGPDSGLHAAPGMTLRDWFAGKALTGMAHFNFREKSANEIAGTCYNLADAMIAARNA